MLFGFFWIPLHSTLTMWLDLSGWLVALHANKKQKNTLLETNIAPENRPLEKEIPIGNHHLQGYVSFRDGNSQKSTYILFSLTRALSPYPKVSIPPVAVAHVANDEHFPVAPCHKSYSRSYHGFSPTPGTTHRLGCLFRLRFWYHSHPIQWIEFYSFMLKTWATQSKSYPISLYWLLDG